MSLILLQMVWLDMFPGGNYDIPGRFIRTCKNSRQHTCYWAGQSQATTLPTPWLAQFHLPGTPYCLKYSRDHPRRAWRKTGTYVRLQVVGRVCHWPDNLLYARVCDATVVVIGCTQWEVSTSEWCEQRSWLCRVVWARAMADDAHRTWFDKKRRTARAPFF